MVLGNDIERETHYIEYEIPTGDQSKSITHRQTRAEYENTTWQGGGNESMKTTIYGDTEPDRCTGIHCKVWDARCKAKGRHNNTNS